jgi:hypothetical protein
MEVYTPQEVEEAVRDVLMRHTPIPWDERHALTALILGRLKGERP